MTRMLPTKGPQPGLNKRHLIGVSRVVCDVIGHGSRGHDMSVKVTVTCRWCGRRSTYTYSDGTTITRLTTNVWVNKQLPNGKTETDIVKCRYCGGDVQ